MQKMQRLDAIQWWWLTESTFRIWTGRVRVLYIGREDTCTIFNLQLHGRLIEERKLLDFHLGNEKRAWNKITGVYTHTTRYTMKSPTECNPVLPTLLTYQKGNAATTHIHTRMVKAMTTTQKMNETKCSSFYVQRTANSERRRTICTMCKSSSWFTFYTKRRAAPMSPVRSWRVKFSQQP